MNQDIQNVTSYNWHIAWSSLFLMVNKLLQNLNVWINIRWIFSNCIAIAVIDRRFSDLSSYNRSRLRPWSRLLNSHVPLLMNKRIIKIYNQLTCTFIRYSNIRLHHIHSFQIYYCHIRMNWISRCFRYTWIYVDKYIQ